LGGGGLNTLLNTALGVETPTIVHRHSRDLQKEIFG